MIDAHCHLEQESYNKDLDEVIKLCKKDGLKAIVSSCTEPKDFDRSIQIIDKYNNYVFLCAAIQAHFE